MLRFGYWGEILLKLYQVILPSGSGTTGGVEKGNASSGVARKQENLQDMRVGESA